MLLTAEEVWLEPYIARLDPPDAERLEYRRALISMEEAEHVVRRTAVQFLPLIRVDVAHHDGYVLLRKISEASAFWQYHSYKLVVVFDRPFLV